MKHCESRRWHQEYKTTGTNKTALDTRINDGDDDVII